MATYYSHACEGVPYGLRYPSLSYARDAAEKALVVHEGIESIEILQINTAHVCYVSPVKTPATVFDPFDPFEGIGL